jgi:hypothetical protein
MTVMRFFIVCSLNLGANAPCFLMMLISWELTFWRQQFPCSVFNAEFPGQNYHRAAGFLREAVLVDFARDHEFNESDRNEPFGWGEVAPATTAQNQRKAANE